MSDRTWKYIDGPVIHDVVVYQGDRSVFALVCTEERVSRVSYTTASLTCLACLGETKLVGWYSYQEEGIAVYNSSLYTNPCAEVPLEPQTDVSLDWFQYRDSKDCLVHDVRRYALTNDMHVSRCRPNDPMYAPEPVLETLTCLLCVAQRNSDPELFAHQEEGLAIINTHALKKINFIF